jgi:diguanylate cyclase (GGDEF)-like protein
VLDLDVTMSLGVAASEPGEPFDFEAVFARADTALYRAKSSGRNRVSVGGSRTEAAVQAKATVVPQKSKRHGARPELVTVPGPSVGSWRERIAREEAETGSWLVRDEIEREHLLELNRRLRAVFRGAALIALVGILIAGPWYGWLVLIPPVVVGLAYNAMEFRLERLRRPEYALAVGWLAFQVSIAAGFCLSTGAPLFALYLFMTMVIGSSAVFPARGVVVGVAFTAVLMIVVAFNRAPVLVGHHPAILLLPLAALVAIACTGWAVGQSAIDHRSASVVDHLTGLLNRTALEARSAELAVQTAQTGEPVAVIVTDLDRFKAVNDNHGHTVGDIVLREAAYRIRKCLRAFESAYRFGGEEFVVLLAGVDDREAAAVAERLWDAVRTEPMNGLPVTMSVGVAASAAGERFDWAAVFARADAALLQAKNDGRDRVQLAYTVTSVVAAPPTVRVIAV